MHCEKENAKDVEHIPKTTGSNYRIQMEKRNDVENRSSDNIIN